MAKFGSDVLSITFDDQGGTPRDVTQYVTSINGVEIEAILEAITAFGDEWERHLGVGLSKMAPIVVGGFHDDTASSGPHAVFRAVDSSPSQASRTFVAAFGGANGTVTVEARNAKYKILGKVGGITLFEATIQPSGAAVWS